MTEAEIIDELSGTWTLLERPGSTLFRAARTCLPGGSRRIQVAVDRVGARHLLIPHPMPATDTDLWRSRSLKLSIATLAGEGDEALTWLVLRCGRADLEDAFVRLCAQMAARVARNGDGPAAELCVGLLQEWTQLFGSAGGDDDPLTGVVGELLLLLRLVRINPVIAWESWEGPRGGRHDFRRKGFALEVKTTLRAASRIVKISGVHQLAPPRGGNLHLLFNRLERVPGGTITLAGLVTELSAAGVPRTDLVSVLEDLGCSIERDTAAFERREELLYEVRNGFPRIVSDSFAGGVMPPGTSALSYSVDLDRAIPVSDAEHPAVLARFATS